MTNEFAIKVLKELRGYGDKFANIGYDRKEALNLAINVLEQTRWIPCSEKMPDINIHVLAQFVMGGMAECYYAHNWWHIVGGFRISGDEVIAWMPLPPSYQGESENKG